MIKIKYMCIHLRKYNNENNLHDNVNKKHFCNQTIYLFFPEVIYKQK